MPRRIKLVFICILTLASSLACLAVERAIFGDEKPASQPAGTPNSAQQAPCTSQKCLAACIASMDGTLPQNYSRTNLNSNQERILVTYAINGDEIYNPQIENAPQKYKQFQEDEETHEAIWDLFTNIVPLEQRTEIAEFIIFTDGPEEVLASVYQTDDDPALWSLEVDIADADNTRELVYTLIHEFAHVLTLNAKQVPPNADVFNHPDSDAIFNKAVDACPNYFPGEGCSQPDSYINLFVRQFWGDIFNEWNEINAIENDNKYFDALDIFYATYQDQFLSEYAPTSPEEDIAESFMYFVLEPKPQNTNRIASQKVLFFYDFPELVNLREVFIGRICAAK